jgi:hypothetical protein
MANGQLWAVRGFFITVDARGEKTSAYPTLAGFENGDPCSGFCSAVAQTKGVFWEEGT